MAEERDVAKRKGEETGERENPKEEIKKSKKYIDQENEKVQIQI